MIYFDRRFKRVWLRYYLCFVDGFVIEWRQNVNRKEEIVGMGFFNKQKRFYIKKGYSDTMHRRMVKLKKDKKKRQ